MPIENNEDFVELEDFSRGVGFNPFEEPVTFNTQRPFDEPLIRPTLSADIFSPATISIAQSQADQLRSLRQFEQLMAHRRGDVAFSEDKPKKKSMSKILDEVSEANKDVFDSLNKVQDEINTLEKTRLVELAEKYDNILFIIIGKSYTLVGASEKNKSMFINTLSQQLFNVINGVTNNHEVSVENFKDRMFRHVSRFLVLDNVINGKFDALFEELYEYYNTVNAKKKEKRALMGREEKKKTVCEDYLYGSNRDNTIRIVLNNY